MIQSRSDIHRFPLRQYRLEEAFAVKVRWTFPTRKAVFRRHIFGPLSESGK